MPDEPEGGALGQQTGSGTQGDQAGGEQTPIDQPNTDVQAPPNIIQTEGVDYSKITTRDAGKSERKKE